MDFAEKPYPRQNYVIGIPATIGLVSGIIGSLAIVIVVTTVVVATGGDTWLAPRIIASSLMGSGAESGAGAVILGTLIHVVTGSVYGLLFAMVMPKMPRPFWIVAGLLFGVATWVLSLAIFGALINPIGISIGVYMGVLLLAHVVFGLVLGLTGATYKVWDDPQG